MPITFDTTGYRQQDQNTWIGPTGDRITLSHFDGVSGLPLGDLARLRHDLALRAAETGCLIEAQVVQLGGVPAVLQISKLPIANRPGQMFGCTFTVTGAHATAVLGMYAEEHGTTGMREGALAAEIGFQRWIMPHPYAPQLQGKLPFHAGDDPRFDSRFPEHPLSRVRRWAHHVVRTAQVDPAFVAQVSQPAPTVQAPVPPPAPNVHVPAPTVQAPVLPAPTVQAPVPPPAPNVHVPAPAAQAPDPTVQAPAPPPAQTTLAPARSQPSLPPIFNAGTLMNAVCGVPVAGYLALQIGERTTYWKMLDDDLLHRLGKGNLGRSPEGEGRFREVVLVDEESGHALMMDRFMTDGASLGVELRLQAVTRDEACAAVTTEALEEAYRWVGRMIEVADGRREFLSLEPIVNQGERVEPFAMMAMQHRDGEEIVVVSCAPAPSENTPFKGSPGINAVVSRAAFEGIGELALQAMLEWGPHPLDMAITFTRFANSAEARSTLDSLTDETRAMFTGELTAAVPGIAIGGYVALQIEDQLTYWRVPEDELYELGAGRLARKHSTGHRFRDVLLIDRQSGELLVSQRYSASGETAGRKITLTPVSAEEAMAAATPEACREAFERLGKLVYFAAKRGEWILVELLENELRQDPYVLLAVQGVFGDEPVALASASPAPSTNTTFNGLPTLEGPASQQNIIGLGPLALEAINDWGVHPLHVVPTYHRPMR